MLDYNEATTGKIIVLDGDPYEVLSHHIFRKQQRKPVNQTKLRNMKTGKVTERSFHAAEGLEEASIETRPVTYVYTNRGEYVFHEDGTPSERFSIPAAILPEGMRFIKEKTTVEAVAFNNEIIGVKIPVKVALTVKEAPPAVKGNTAQGATKQVVLETGATVQAPLFINEGDMVEVNTETGAYTARAEKK